MPLSPILKIFDTPELMELACGKPITADQRWHIGPSPSACLAAHRPIADGMFSPSAIADGMFSPSAIADGMSAGIGHRRWPCLDERFRGAVWPQDCFWSR